MIKIPVVNKGITMTEIPNHIAVFFEIGNCTCHCEGCHSPELWDSHPCTTFMDYQELLQYIQQQYKLGANAVLFMGGLRSKGLDAIEFAARILPPLYSQGYKIGLYDGKDLFLSDPPINLALPWLKWFKAGSYKADLGGLDHKGTNQVFFEINSLGDLIDKTAEYFQKGETI